MAKEASRSVFTQRVRAIFAHQGNMACRAERWRGRRDPIYRVRGEERGNALRDGPHPAPWTR